MVTSGAEAAKAVRKVRPHDTLITCTYYGYEAEWLSSTFIRCTSVVRFHSYPPNIALIVSTASTTLWYGVSDGSIPSEGTKTPIKIPVFDKYWYADNKHNFNKSLHRSITSIATIGVAGNFYYVG